MPRGRSGSSARFEVTGFSAERMRSIGDALITSMKSRMAAALTVNDTPAPPLKPRYARFKKRRYGRDVRDLKATGKTLEALSVLRTAANRAEIGFSDPRANMIVAINARRARQFGVSPRDSETIAPLFRDFITTKKV